MKRVCTAFVGLVCVLAGLPVFAAGPQPNIVYILVDNWGWGDISIQGSTVPTRRIDQLAVEGTRFTNFNVQNQCTPTRSAIHTGRLPIRSGTQKVAAPGEPDGLSPMGIHHGRTPLRCRVRHSPLWQVAHRVQGRADCPMTRDMMNGGGSMRARTPRPIPVPRNSIQLWQRFRISGRE